eukprot:TRINITY_DN20237_c0_g1_i2.p1 TRINITY_DN20237_c0_g1~~TRINITY_DN20237_c0_g1_i2.p1  ORF type:complete len:109 (+),score=21.40 TRINITY_DN20237_c0_g1_i2:266-592(+)
MMLRWLQKTGHQPIVLMGGGTSKIGDPSGRDESRQLMTDEIIADNMAGIRTVFDRLLTFGDSKTDAVMVNNGCLLYTSDAADEEDSVDLGGRRIIKKKNERVIPLHKT